MTKQLKFGILLIVLGLVLFGVLMPLKVSFVLRSIFFIGVLVILTAGCLVLSSRKAIGGFEGKKMRPDLVIPDGVALVMGTVFVGLGVRELTLKSFTLPTWNWWGFLIAILGMLILIPVRGMFKMKSRKARMVEGKMKGLGEIIVKELLLVIGILVLAYGFHNVFNGLTPFTYPLVWNLGAAAIAVAFLILIFIRGIYKLGIDSKTETKKQMFTKDLIYFVSLLIFFWGMMTVLSGEYKRILTVEGFIVGLTIAILGFLLLTFVREHIRMNVKQEMMAFIKGKRRKQK